MAEAIQASEEKTNDIEQAKKLIEEEKMRRAAACMAEVQAVLKKYNCDLVPVIQVKANE